MLTISEPFLQTKVGTKFA